MQGKTVKELQIGDSAEFTKTITETDIVLFGGLTGDLNPMHMNEEWAKQTRFGGRIAQGMLSAGIISGVVGMQLPGPGTVYVSQELRFLAPIKIGDTVTARVTVEEIIVEKNRAQLRTQCINQSGTVVVDGAAWVMPPK